MEKHFGSGVHPPKERKTKMERGNSTYQNKGNVEEERKVRGKTEIESEKINQQENRKSKGM